MARRRSPRERRARRARLTAGPRARRDARRGGRTARDIVTRSNVGRIARQRIGEVGPGGGVRSVARGALRSQLGRRLLTIARQRFSRIPVIGRFAATTRRARGLNVSPVPTSTAMARRFPTRTALVTGGSIAAGGAAFEAGRTIFDAIPQGVEMVKRFRGGRRGTGGRQQNIPFTPGGIVPTDSITHTWVANGVQFAQLADGRVMVRRKNGTIKTFRRPRPIVLGRNPGVRDIVRADKKIDALLKLVRKRFPAARRRHSQAHN